MLSAFRTFVSSRSPREQTAQKFKPALELLGDRLVPTALTWTDAARNQDFYTDSNWVYTGTATVASSSPVTGDDVTFDGNVSSDSCNDIGPIQMAPPPPPPPGGAAAVSVGGNIGLNSLNLINQYVGTVTLIAPQQIGTLNLEAAPTGGIAQPFESSGNDITVTSAFTWTSGVLNSSGTTANMHLVGAIATINPGEGNTVTTADTLSFENGATGTFLPGTLNFTSGDGIVVNEFCEMNVLVAAATAKFSEKNAGTDEKKNWIKTGGTITVTGPGTWEAQALPVVNEGGQFTLKGGATASLSGSITLNNVKYYGYSQFGNTSVLLLENGTVLEVPGTDLISLKGGKLSTTRAATGPQSAQIRGHLWIGNADIELDDPGFAPAGSAHVFSTLVVSGQLDWYGGVFRPSVGWTAADATGKLASDKIEVSGDTGKVNIDVNPLPAGGGGTTGAKLGPRPVVNAGNRNLTNVTWDVITGVMDGLGANATSVPFELANQGNDWSDGLSNDNGALELKHK